MRSLNTLSLHHDCRGISGRVISAIAASLVLSSLALSGCAQTTTNYDDRTFFRDEQGLETHGRKTWFDHLVELDPGGLKIHMAADYDQAAPEKIAVLPFIDTGSAQYVVDKIALTHRSDGEQADWAWTDANRMRRAVNGYLASREFLEANIIQVDSTSHSMYNGLWVTTTKNFQHGLQFLFTYNWTKSMDLNSLGSQGGYTLQDSNNPKSN